MARSLGVDDAFRLVEELATELLGVEPESLIARLKSRLARPTSWSQVLDTLEAMMASWAVLDDSWATSAKNLLLARIYEEALGNWRKMLPLRGIERRLKWQGLRLLYSRYLLRSGDGLVKETPDQMVWRVSSYVAMAEHPYGTYREAQKLFYELLSSLRFVPNSPTLMNAGTRYPQLAACFVIPLGDDTDAILEAIRVSAWLFRTGAGAGYDFSPLRPRGSPIAGTGGHSSGPVSFMRIFDTVADVMKEGGKRRAAMMGILHDWHPDLMEFIEAKCGDKLVLENFNISVAVHDKFMEAVESGGTWSLYSPQECPGIVASLSNDIEELGKLCKPVKTLSAAEILEKIAYCAWRGGDPGLVFIDTINKHNPTPLLGRIHSTNPCGETPLLDWEACNLGSINLVHYVDEKNKRILWDRLAEDVKLAIRFLDDVIEVSRYPDKRIDEAVRRTRKIGLGVMGWADMLAMLEIPYDSHDALFLADKLMEFIEYHAREASNELAEERGPYPAFSTSIHREGRFNFEPQVPSSDIYDISKVSDETKKIVEERPGLDWETLRRRLMRGTRNATVTTIAPTGSISIIAGVSSSIEPFFALVYIRHSAIGSWIEVHPKLRKWLQENNMLREEVLSEIASKGGGIRWAPWAPESLKRILPTALEIGWEWHVRMQAAFQRWVDNAVSKTINMPYSVKVSDVLEAFKLAWRLGCKGITVYRDKSRPTQVLEVSGELSKLLEKPPEPRRHKDKQVYNWIRIGKKELMVVREDYSGGCPTCDI
ncbi:MAG: adenosylcobalamin-dependent ribonucleoside-diphosphate reductase [Pyrodictiaceae archaeon]